MRISDWSSDVCSSDLDQALAPPGCQQSRLIDKVGQIGAREAGCAAGNDTRLHVRGKRHLLHVHRKDLLPSLYVRARPPNLPVEAAGAQQRRIQPARPVGGLNTSESSTPLKTATSNKN